MTDSIANFGDFVVLARRHLAEAAEFLPSVTPGRQTQELADGLTQLVQVLARYTRDLIRSIGAAPGRPAASLHEWEQAALDADYALGSAHAELRRIPGNRSSLAGSATFRSAAGVTAAAAALAAGRDLLQGHFTTAPSGARMHGSGWASSITSPPVSMALLSEITALAGTAASTTRLAQPPRLAGARPSEPEKLLASAGSWLARCQVTTASVPEPDRLTRELLHAIPVNVMPQRTAQQDPPTIPFLCQAVALTAGRTIHASWTAGTVSPGSPAISIASWRATAAAATVTSHHCHILCASLATDERLTGAALDGLREGIRIADQARRTWLRLARQLQDVTTDTRGYLSPAAVEITDLAIWTGRLAYANSDWTLSSGPDQPARTARDLAPRPADIPAVVAAVHHTSEALTSAAQSVVQQAHSADRADRILVRTRSGPEQEILPRPFTVASAYRARLLLHAGYDAETSARATSDALGWAAEATRASSRTLATARAASGHLQGSRALQQPPSAQHDPAPEPGPCEAALREQGIVETQFLWRAAALDRTARQYLTDTAARQATLRAAPPARPRPRAGDLEAGR